MLTGRNFNIDKVSARSITPKNMVQAPSPLLFKAFVKQPKLAENDKFTLQ
jgi:hypothetical protein